DTGEDCTFNTGEDCTFKTGGDCTFNTGWNCTFKTGRYCAFKTGRSCTFNTGWNCAFKTGEECVVVRRDVFEVIQLDSEKEHKLFPYGYKGFLVRDKGTEQWFDNAGNKWIIADGVFSQIV